MKIKTTQRKAAFVAAILASAVTASFSYAKPDQTQEKIRLMVAAVQARDAGDLKSSKQSLEELLKIAPNDEGVQRMLADVNKDIERQAKGETPVLVGAKAAQEEAAAKDAEVAKDGEEAEAAEGEAKVEPVDAAMSDALRKQQLQVIAAFDLIDEAYDLMDDGNWDEAAKKLSFAQEKLPEESYSPIADEARSELNRAKAAMAKSRAKIAMSERDTAAAKSFAAEYAAAEESKDAGNAFVEEVEEFTANPYNNSISDISPDYATRQNKIENLLEKGRRQYLYGDYQGARATFRQIETLDADNIQAKAYQRLISEKLADRGRLTYLATREAMMDEVSKAWQRPQVYTGTTVDRGGARADSVIDKKLAEIIIPNVSFPAPGVTLAQAINTLSILSVEYDKSNDAKKGVNIVLFGDNASEAKPVVLTLRDLSLGQILDWVTQQAGFQYDIEKDTIVVRKAMDNSVASMDTLDFPLPTSTVMRMIGFKAAVGESGDSDNPFGGGGGGAAAGAGDGKEEAIKNFLVKAGVEFGPGATVAFDGSKLWVTNTRRNLDKVRNILLRYSETKQVEIEAKFMEVNQGVLKELGFNWNVSRKNADGSFSTLFSTVGRNTTGLISTYNNRTLADSITSASAGSTPITILKPAAEVTADVPNPYTVEPVVPILPSTINMASGAAQAANTVLGVINGYDVSLIVNALEQRQGSDLLCAPKVTVISGSTASITVSQRMRYPESWGDVQSNVGSSSVSVGDTQTSSAGVTITPGTPQDFTSVDVGVSMEVTPNVEEDDSINLVLNPNVTEFEGFMEYGGVAVAISSGTTVTVPSGFIQPVFSVREVKTTVTVFDGATVVMGGLTREEVRTINDSVPILSDIPWIGRLFRSKGESRQKRNLLIFVTANRISPGGSVGREQFQDMRPGSVYQNPVIVSPGGAVHRVLEDEATETVTR